MQRLYAKPASNEPTGPENKGQLKEEPHGPFERGHWIPRKGCQECEGGKRIVLEAAIVASGASPILRLEEAFELADAGRVAHFTERLRLDLPDAFASDLELPAYFLKRTTVAVH
jgi:hypothetical protein